MTKQRKNFTEKNRMLHFETGLVIVLALLLVAFNWRTDQVEVADLGSVKAIPLEDDVVQTTRQQEVKPPPPPKMNVIEELTIIDNTEEENIGDIDTEFDEDDAMKVEDIQIEPEQEHEENPPFVHLPQEKAKFPGGMQALFGFLKDNLQYPQIARDNGIKGTVNVQFTVGPDGHISDIKILRSPDPLLSEEAIRVIKLMPPWEPAEHGNQKVYTRMQLPVVFNIR